MSKVFTITDGLDNLGAFRTGGQGSVYKGRRMGEIITAVKLLPTPIYTENTDNKSYHDFKNEVEKLKKVNQQPNPNVVKILSSGLTDSGSFPFIEMEYIDGPDLEELLKPPHDPVFTIKEVIKVAEHLANALAHCHAMNVKHGDIKSNNVKYNIHTGNYVLLDFGLAIMSDEQRRTSMRQAGAIEFMAPEQYEGLMLLESDIYSYGIILYELLAGQVPFPLTDNGETSRNTVRVSHIEADIPDMTSLRRQHLPVTWSDEKQQREMLIPLWLKKIIKKCLEKKPENRFKDGMALMEALQESRISDHHLSMGTMFSVKEEHLERLNKSQAKPVAGVFNREVRIPLPLFLSALFILFGLLAFAGYHTFKSKAAVSSVAVASSISDTYTPKKTSMIHPAIPKSFMNTVVLNLDSIVKAEEKAREIARAKARAKQREPEFRNTTDQELQKGKKKKKKKLLDILF